MGPGPGRYPHIQDEPLVVGALLGNMGAFDELVRRYRGAVTLVARQEIGSREAAEDVAQETFLLAMKALPQLADASRFAGWLCAIARNRARRVGSGEARAQATAPSEVDRLILAHSHELHADPEREVVRRDEAGLVEQALESLPLDHRLVLELYYREQWPVARIAAFLTIPATTVKWRLHRGRQMMRRKLASCMEET